MANLQTFRQYVHRSGYKPSLTRSTATLWPHQKVALEFSLSMPKSLLYSGVSTGKSLIALQYCEHFKGLRLIVCPAKPISVYAEDFKNLYPNGADFKLYSLDRSSGTIAEKGEIIRRIAEAGESAVIIISYETAFKLPIASYAPSAVVCDEAHRLGAFNSKQSIALAISCAEVPAKMAMTGTAFDDSYARLYGIYRWLDPVLPKRGYPVSKLFGSYSEFLDAFCVTWVKGYTRIIKSYKNLGKLADSIKPTCLLIKTEDVIDLPEAVYRSYPIPMTDATAEKYLELRDDAVIRFEQEFGGEDAIFAPHVLTRVLRLQQLTSSGELVSEAGETYQFDITPRIEVLKSILEELESEPVVIFTRFRRDVQIISQLIEENLGYKRPALLTGDVDEHEAWKDGQHRILIANIASGSEGIRLNRAHHCIFWSVGYSLKQFRQAHARTRRHGQKAPTVFFHYLLTAGSVDEVIYQALQRKQSEVDTLDTELKANEAPLGQFADYGTELDLYPSVEVDSASELVPAAMDNLTRRSHRL